MCDKKFTIQGLLPYSKRKSPWNSGIPQFSSCNINGGGSTDTWNMTFTSGSSTSSYFFEVPEGFTESVTNSCLICCSGTIVSWNESNGQLSATTTCSGTNNADTQITGTITGNSVEGTWSNVWTNGNTDSGTFTGIKQ